MAVLRFSRKMPPPPPVPPLLKMKMTRTAAKTTESGPVALCMSIELVLASAAELARQNRHADAERLLVSLPADAITAPALDLLARIYAQQGRYGDAEAKWMSAIQLDPSNQDYLTSLKAAERFRSGAGRHRRTL